MMTAIQSNLMVKSPKGVFLSRKASPEFSASQTNAVSIRFGDGKSPQHDTALANPLFDALKQGNQETLQQLLQAGADVNTQDAQGHTPLHLAVAAGRIDLVEVLLKAGARTDIKDKSGKTPLKQEALSRYDVLLKRFGGKPIEAGIEYKHPDVVARLYKAEPFYKRWSLKVFHFFQFNPDNVPKLK